MYLTMVLVMVSIVVRYRALGSLDSVFSSVVRDVGPIHKYGSQESI